MNKFFKLFGRRATYIILIVFFSYQCGQSDESESEFWGNKDNIENENAITLNHNGVEREYLLHVPEIYTGSVPVPVVMNFHGGGGTATGQMYLADMRPIADTANFILVYPQGLQLDNGGSTHWNSMLLSDSNKSTVDDFGFIDALINELSLTYNIDPKRLYATGFSNGADIAFTLGCYLNSSIAAVAPVSGLMLDNPSSDSCAPSNRVGVMIIHGTSDDARPLNGINGYYASIDEAIAFWSDVNSTSLNPNITSYSSDGLTVELHSYLDQEENAYIEYYKIINGEHLWLDIANNGAGTNQLIWNFLSQFSSEL